MHRCHIGHCDTATKPELLFCYSHWAMVPKNMQSLVYKHYTKGQCNDNSKIKRDWIKCAANARVYVTWLSTGSSPSEAMSKIPYPECLEVLNG